MDLLTNLNSTLENGVTVNLDVTSTVYLGIALFAAIFLAIVAAKLLVK